MLEDIERLEKRVGELVVEIDQLREKLKKKNNSPICTICRVDPMGVEGMAGEFNQYLCVSCIRAACANQSRVGVIVMLDGIEYGIVAIPATPATPATPASKEVNEREKVASDIGLSRVEDGYEVMINGEKTTVPTVWTVYGSLVRHFYPEIPPCPHCGGSWVHNTLPTVEYTISCNRCDYRMKAHSPEEVRELWGRHYEAIKELQGKDEESVEENKDA